MRLAVGLFIVVREKAAEDCRTPGRWRVGRSADFQSAVSRICNPQALEIFQARRRLCGPAECNSDDSRARAERCSAIQQIANLRYERVARLKTAFH